MATSNIGTEVQEFYNETPFPDYDLDRFHSKYDIVKSASTFAHVLNRSIPKDASVIDIGTGTGQLSAFLSLERKCVWGIDFSDASLNKARALKAKIDLQTLHLKKVDILNLRDIESIGMQFDYVLCLGVLHHTGNAYGSFKNILNLLANNGHIAIGLYNKLGRIPLKLRKYMVRTVLKDNKQIKNRFLKMQLGETDDEEKKRGWWNDQYLHPHETTHTVGEVLNWFKKNNIEYYETVPSLDFLDQVDLEISGIWNKKDYPYLPVRLAKQLAWIWQTHHEGGYWVTFGKKR